MHDLYQMMYIDNFMEFIAIAKIVRSIYWISIFNIFINIIYLFIHYYTYRQKQ